jgi:general stress protein 26
MPEGMRDHEVVSVFPFSKDQIDQLMNDARECVLMWGTKDGWPVGVYHSFVWQEGHIWITCAAHRHRVAAIERDPRVSVAVSGVSGLEGTPRGAATIKGRATIREDQQTKDWFYRALAHKSNPDDKAAEEDFFERLDSPLRIIIEVIPEKWITFDSEKSAKDVAGTLTDEERGPRLNSDAVRMRAERKARGLDPDSR